MRHAKYILLIILFCSSCRKEEAKTPVIEWSNYHECKYFIILYDQLKKSNPRVKQDFIEQGAINIGDAIEKEFKVDTLVNIPNKYLLDIAFKNRKSKVCYGYGENEECIEEDLYTELLNLNIDLNK